MRAQKKEVFMIFIVFIITGISPDALLKKIDSIKAPDNYKMTIKMNNHFSDGRYIEYKMRIFVKKNKGSYMEILSPSRDAGRSFLLVGNNFWMYVPGMSKTIRLSVRDNFMGTNFSNSDMMEAHFKDNYKPVKVDSFSDKYILYLEAKNQKASYKRIEIDVRKDFIPEMVRYYTLSDRLFRKMILDSIKTIDGEPYTTYMKMENLLTEGSYTEVFIESLKKKKDIPNRFFNPDYLRNRW